MNFKKGLLMYLLFLILIGCANNKTINFQGESENWKVDYVVDIIAKDSETSNLSIRYIGENQIPIEIDYQIKYGSTSKASGHTSLEEGVLNTSGGSCSGCAVTKENQEIDVIIEWNGESENIKLDSK